LDMVCSATDDDMALEWLQRARGFGGVRLGGLLGAAEQTPSRQTVLA